MKKTIKILALALCIITLFSFSSCVMDAEQGVPEGMINATVPGSYFRLYVPSTWTPNTAYGISGAYATISTRSNVSVARYPVSEEMTASMPDELKNADVASSARLDWFYEAHCLSAVQSLSPNAVMFSEPAATTLGGSNARRYHRLGQADGNEMHFEHVITEYVSLNGGAPSSAFYVVSFTIDSKLYNNLLSNVESIIAKFVFSTEPYLPDTYMKPLDGSAPAPEGMKLASNGEVAYLFYVPSDWTVNRDERIFSAYDPTDYSSVSVIPYMPDTSMSIAELWEINKKAMEATAGIGFEQIGEPDTTRIVAGKPCYAYRYCYTVGGQRYDYLQIILIHGDKFYNITYTALPEHYYEHLDEVDSILSNLVFR